MNAAIYLAVSNHRWMKAYEAETDPTGASTYRWKDGCSCFWTGEDFYAHLTEEIETAQKIAAMPGVSNVFPGRAPKVHPNQMPLFPPEPARDKAWLDR